MNKAAICAFVKTPGVSPVKSRLAAACGVNKAESFYFASVNDTENLLRSLKDIAPEIIPWWAVAEEEAHNNSLWASFQKIEQGPGGLGQRLNYVYKNLIAESSPVIFIGADAPHMQVEVILQLTETLREEPRRAVLGKAEDGGFYIFGANVPIPAEVWLRVEYSRGDTANTLAENLMQNCSVSFVQSNFDVDDEASLEKLRMLWREGRLPAHCRALDNWFRLEGSE